MQLDMWAQLSESLSCIRTLHFIGHSQLGNACVSGLLTLLSDLHLSHVNLRHIYLTNMGITDSFAEMLADCLDDLDHHRWILKLRVFGIVDNTGKKISISHFSIPFCMN